ncbi:MAG TPA: hypothetical protein VN578_22805 [Candidatus Binatia bacterium]|jgi:hypothetical protein|nr:hypothetical protein [Candidatus Binatia bacterium]
MKRMINIALAMMFVAVSWANDAAKTSALHQTLSQVPAAEMPAKAGELVKAAKARDRGFLTVDVVKTAIAINPVAAPAIVGAISRAVPDMASIAASTAAELQPKLAPEIAKAAAAAAPSKAGKIVVAICRVVPQQYHDIATNVAQAAPGSGQEILRALASLFPELKPGIDQALAGYAGTPPSVVAVLDSARVSANLGAPTAPMNSLGTPTGPPVLGGLAVRGPSIAPPYIVPSGTATNFGPSGTRGGRNYAAP